MLVGLIAILFNAVQYQNSFDLCKRIDFKDKQCKHHEEMVKLNPKSKHSK